MEPKMSVEDPATMENFRELYNMLERVGCKVYPSANLNLHTVTWTKVPLNTVTYQNEKVKFDTTNNRFLCPSSGYILIVGQIYFVDVTADKNYAVGIYKNGVVVTRSEAQSSYMETVMPQATDINKVDKGDYLELYGWQNSGVDETMCGGNDKYTFMSLRYLL